MAPTSVLLDPLQLCAPDSTYLALLIKDRPDSPLDGNLMNSAMHTITFDEVHCLASLHDFQPFDPLHFWLQHPAHNSRVYNNLDVHHHLTSYGPPPSVVPVYTDWFRPGFTFTTINTENDIYEYLTQCQFTKLDNLVLDNYTWQSGSGAAATSFLADHPLSKWWSRATRHHACPPIW
ncbi:hypothetical protein SERLA73DRAFT_187229 [Serpula lacrymans var. lacrymans S7.3]|uniref:Uncharacterized protein n=2 Tax=Serpula lacrymans var. lacrymans TaxID=341189 RepID=F8Q8Q2_SERL3|nr:uncharacterized protein SERLADRAFT_476650 [Serpula lacrymans var. lacrymans S7.9]EGN94957.1 hypothetical protein SERLA73DRAFT_187229 [Serpula lacrymans var. lacrymans S7.3]EGO20447.1 hypothetical protein SERLADRAFT_476650 [Serpula lacrymans var. lacrymans S7.9]